MAHAPRIAGLLRHAGIAALAGLLGLAGALDVLEEPLSELRFRLLDRPATGRVLLVAIDPESLAALDVWPWPRGYHATLLENLLQAGAERVAFDLDFSSRSIPEEDREFARALRAARPRAILPVFRQWETGSDGPPRLLVTGPIPALATETTLAGINIQPDPDGLVRRYASAEGETRGTFASALAGAGANAGPFSLDFSIDTATIPSLSYLEVLTGAFDPESVRGRSVIVGATAVELGDQMAVPLHATLPGPVVQALAFESIVQGRMLNPPTAGVLLIALILAGAGLGLLIEEAGWRRGLIAALAGGAALFALAAGLQSRAPILVPVAPFMVAFAGSWVAGLVRRIDRQGLRLMLQSLRLRSSETRMRHVIENSTDAIVTVDDGGRIETYNTAAERLFGWPATEILGREIGLVVDGGFPEIPADGPGGATPGSSGHREGTGRRRDGSSFPLEMTVTAFSLEGRRRRTGFLRDISTRKAQERALEHQATHDALTRLPNRVLLRDRLEEALRQARESRRPLAFLLLDLDRFKEVNDTLGHQVGDRLLQRIARRLLAPVGESGTIARLGGDEFALLLPGAGAEQARETASRLIDALREPFELNGLSLQVEASIGVAMHPEHGSDPAALIQHADVAMYVAKRIRNTVAFYDPEEDFNSIRHLTLHGELKRAVEEDHLLLHYQPKVDARSGRLDGVEALLRWRHPRHGLVRPDEFIPLAEYTGLIKPITHWVLEKSLHQAALWEREGITLSVAVNCSARNLLEEDLPKEIGRRLGARGIRPERLVLEITETAIIENPRRALEVLTELAGMGIRISIDDFGTGYSSLEYLKRLPATELKIDRSFVMGMAGNESDAVIVRSTVDLAHNLGIRAVAEGVDQAAVWEKLRSLGCDTGQGYFFSRPIPGAELIRWARTSPWGIGRHHEEMESVLA